MKKLSSTMACLLLAATGFTQNCEVIATASPDCRNGITYLYATSGYTSYSWSPAGAVSNPNAHTTSTTTPGTYTVTATSTSGPELVTNGTFSAGNVGFTSGHTFQAPQMPCRYYVHQYWFGNPAHGLLPDHTPTTDNLYMQIDGCASGTKLWEQTINVTAGTNYTFSFWATRSQATQPQFQISMIGNVTGGGVVSTQTGVAYTGGFVWDQYSAPVWNSGTNTSVTIIVKNLQGAGYGNDFGMDDFSLRGSCVSSTTITVAVPGINLFSNEDFSASNTGFTSGHGYAPVAVPCNYFVGPGWFSSTYDPNYPDHTPTSDNMFMQVDGCTAGPTVVWEQAINVQSATVYSFSFWATDSRNPVPQFEIHFIGNVTGDVVVSTQTGNSYNGYNWSEYSVPCWNSMGNSTVTVQVINLTTSYDGNEFGMDDFVFKQCCNPDACCQPGDPEGRLEGVAPMKSNEISVFPNPGNGHFQVQLEEGEGIATFELFNLVGERIDACTFIGNVYNYAPEQGLAPGTYLMRITRNGEEYNERIVVE